MEGKIIKLILKVGIPTMIMEAISSFILLLLNKILMNISAIGVAVFGIYTKVEKFIFIIIYGFNYAMMPMLGYCLGAKKHGKVKEIIKFFRLLSFCISCIGMLLFLCLSRQIIGWFGVEEETLSIGVFAFRVLSLGFIFEGMNIVLSAIFQSFEKATYSLVINLFRKIIIAMPIILLLKNIFGLTIVWWSFTIAEVITFVVAVILYRNLGKGEEKNVQEIQKSRRNI